MIYKTIGNTGIDVSIIGLGTVKLGRDQGVKYPQAFKIPDDKEALSLLSCAQALGVNLIDTAPAYGNSEERLGYLLGANRKSWIICSKTGEEFEDGVSHFNFSPEHTRYSIERSLKRLKTDYIDIVLIHSDGNDLSIINDFGTLDILAELKKQGKIRAFGMSTKTVAGSMLAAKKSDLVMLTYNLDDKSEEETIAFCQKNNIGVLIKKALASGHLVSAGEDTVQTSMDFIFKNQGVTSAIVGTISEQHLQHNIACALRACNAV